MFRESTTQKKINEKKAAEKIIKSSKNRFKREQKTREKNSSVKVNIVTIPLIVVEIFRIFHIIHVSYGDFNVYIVIEIFVVFWFKIFFSCSLVARYIKFSNLRGVSLFSFSGDPITKLFFIELEND